jgi:hypothetical protein
MWRDYRVQRYEKEMNAPSNQPIIFVSIFRHLQKINEKMPSTYIEKLLNMSPIFTFM